MSGNVVPASSWVAPWLRFVGIYAAYSFAAHLAWEIAQLPLYTIWQTGPAGYIAFAVLHCTVGDVLIATASLLAALPIGGVGAWPPRRFAALVAATMALGVGYTIYSEWLNVYVRQSWAYAEAMPLLFGIGVAPLAQWVVVPPIGLIWARRRA
jgi:hypothetical protein